MSIYFEETRKLGNLLLTSEEAINLADANDAFDRDENAKEKMRTYQEFQKKLQEGIKSGAMHKDDILLARKNLEGMLEDLKQDPTIGPLYTAEKEFNNLMNKVLNVLKMTVNGKTAPADGGGCSSCASNTDGGSCSGCN